MNTNCNHKFYNHGFIKNLVNNEEKKTPIKIEEYLGNELLQKQVKEKLKIIVCKHDHHFIGCKSNSEERKSYFKHNSTFVHDILHLNNETEWHKIWKNNFEEQEVCISNKNRADVKIHDKTLEFQHSRISREKVNERSKNHLEAKYKINWIIDCTDDTIYDEKLCDDIYLIKFHTNCWKFESFLDIKYIYLDCNEIIYRICPKDVNNNMIRTNNFISKNEYIKSLKENINPWKNENVSQCHIYVIQRGAGCGKTYESIQLLTGEKFKEKTSFIYLTKINSAKTVIYREFKEQEDEGRLEMLEDIQEIKSNQYIIKYNNNLTNKPFKVIIGTIDSFFYKIGDKNHDENAFFKGLVNSVGSGYADKTKSIKYGDTKINFDQNTIIIIDEAQDLDNNYTEAIVRIAGITFLDIYLIGDKLQSIWNSDNVFVNFSKLKTNEQMKIIVEKGKNHVRRFHNNGLGTFVNSIIDFEKYGLEQITAICEDNSCGYPHEEDKQPCVFISMNMGDEDKNIETIIFPVLKSNTFAQGLQNEIENYWNEKLGEIENTYCYLHTSEEGSAIDLNESKDSTIIISIHTSKGQGRKVVFFLELSEKNLNVFEETNSLKFDSLMHVGITRQKLKLYIGFYGDISNDVICQKIHKYCGDEKIEMKYSNSETIEIDEKFDFNYISSDNCNKKFKELDELFDIREKKNLLQENRTPSNINFEHHVLRNSMLKTQFPIHVLSQRVHEYKDIVNLNKFHNEFFDQTAKILKEISNAKIEHCDNFDKYKSFLKDMKKFDDSKPKYIKIFQRKGHEYYWKIIEQTIKRIQEKLKRNRFVFCALESILLQYLLELYCFYSHADIHTVYKLLKCYVKLKNDGSIVCKSEIECSCNILFKCNKISNQNDKVIEFIEYIVKVEESFKLTEKYIGEKHKGEKFKCNVNHRIQLTKNIGKMFPLIAYSDKSVIIYHLKPQFTSINFNENFVEMIYDTYLVANCINKKSQTEEYKKDKNKFRDKKIVHCIVSFSQEPIFYEDIYDKYNENKVVILNTIKDCLLVWYEKINKRIYEFIKSEKKKFMKACEDEKTQIPDYVINLIKNIKNVSSLNKDDFLKIMKEKSAEYINGFFPIDFELI